MKNILLTSILSILLTLPVVAQEYPVDPPLPEAQIPITFAYDASGNRTAREINLSRSSSGLNRALPLKPDVTVAEIPEDVQEEESSTFFTDRLSKNDVIIYPNPTRGVLAVEFRRFTGQERFDVAIYNLLGGLVLYKKNVESYTTMDISSRPSGIYIMRISTGKSHLEWKIIKE